MKNKREAGAQNLPPQCLFLLISLLCIAIRKLIDFLPVTITEY